jgi:hypothetical protein
MEEIFIALVPKEFSRIQIQTTVFLKEGKTYVNSVNIIYEGRILEKIKQENGKELKYLNPDKIASDYILNKLKIENKKSKSRTTSNKKNAANTIMNEFNL